MITIHEPRFRIWVKGKPMSWRKKRKSLERYSTLIAEAAKLVVPRPTKSRRLDIELWFCASNLARADVDNIVKPVLDALAGVVYIDDSQVRSLKVVALPEDDVVGISGWSRANVFKRLIKANPKEFLINVFEGISIPGNGP